MVAASVPDGSEGSEEAEAQNPHAATRERAVWPNDFCTPADNRNYPDVKMRVMVCWKNNADLGRVC
eukprot:9024933-Lingulodinium_polyedra.AAC.1